MYYHPIHFVLQDDGHQREAHFPSNVEEHIHGDSIKPTLQGLSVNNLNHSTTSLGSSSSGDYSKHSYTNSMYRFSLEFAAVLNPMKD